MPKKKPKFGYCAVTADILHVGHINFLNQCALRCKHLIVGVMTDEVVKRYKGKKPIVPFNQRRKIVKHLDMVYRVFDQTTFEYGRYVINQKKHYGDDFVVFDSAEHDRKGADYIIRRTPGISSTKIKGKICGS